MSEKYNRYNLEADFKKYLLAENIAPQSVKQYMSDYRHFIDWSCYRKSEMGQNKALSFQELDILDCFTSQEFGDYRQYLQDSQVPHKTVNRRLSTLRKLSSYLFSQKLITENLGADISNVSLIEHSVTGNLVDELIETYSKELNLSQKEKSAELKTVKDFLSFTNF